MNDKLRKKKTSREKRTEYQRQYLKRRKRLVLLFNPNTDQDILEWIDKQPVKSVAIKDLIRESAKKAP